MPSFVRLSPPTTTYTMYVHATRTAAVRPCVDLMASGAAAMGASKRSEQSGSKQAGSAAEAIERTNERTQSDETNDADTYDTRREGETIKAIKMQFETLSVWCGMHAKGLHACAKYCAYSLYCTVHSA